MEFAPHPVTVRRQPPRSEAELRRAVETRFEELKSQHELDDESWVEEPIRRAACEIDYILGSSDTVLALTQSQVEAFVRRRLDDAESVARARLARKEERQQALRGLLERAWADVLAEDRRVVQVLTI